MPHELEVEGHEVDGHEGGGAGAGGLGEEDEHFLLHIQRMFLVREVGR